MANRPVFVPDSVTCVRSIDTDFEWFAGFARSQKLKCVASLHEAFSRKYPDARVLEISRYSDTPLGASLSAFNLTVETSAGLVPVECAYQAGKVLMSGGPYTDLLTATPKAAKTDPRLREGGRIVRFTLDGVDFPTRPTSLFYTWLYLKALRGHGDLGDQLLAYDAFTDIAFNPEKSASCQAYAAAAYVALRRRGDDEVARAVEAPDLLAEALRTRR